MKLLLFAQLSEAAATIEALNAKAQPNSEKQIWSEGIIPTRYSFDDGLIVITDVGLYPAAAAVAKYGPTCSEIWNLGLAGTLSHNLDIGTLLPISRLGKYIPIPNQHATAPADLKLGDSGIALVSSDFPIHEHVHREHLSANYDMVDMEGYAIAYMANALGIKCRMWKIVSDFASPGGRELISKNKHQLSKKIAEHIIESSTHS